MHSRRCLVLQFNHLLPRFPAGYFIPPPLHVLPRREKLRPVRIIHQIMPVRQMRKISQRELISGQISTLSQSLLVHIKHLRQLLLVLLNRLLILRQLHPRRKRQLKNKNRARGIEVLPLRFNPLFDRSFP
uniref:Uncharacterized protein n=1 Tax=Cucumis melo TaxID=3656 RepID=A0A9I9E8Y4_CUCME